MKWTNILSVGTLLVSVSAFAGEGPWSVRGGALVSYATYDQIDSAYFGGQLAVAYRVNESFEPALSIGYVPTEYNFDGVASESPVNIGNKKGSYLPLLLEFNFRSEDKTVWTYGGPYLGLVFQRGAATFNSFSPDVEGEEPKVEIGLALGATFGVGTELSPGQDLLLSLNAGWFRADYFCTQMAFAYQHRF